MNKKAIITGAPGQDAYYLAKLLLEKDYKVICTYRYGSTDASSRFAGWDIMENVNFSLELLDITDICACLDLVRKHEDASELYNLAAASHVGQSFKNPLNVWEVNCKGPINLMEAIRKVNGKIKFYQASTSELWGSNYSSMVTSDLDYDDPNFLDYGSMSGVSKYQDEDTPFSPNSPYAAAKLGAHNMVRIYRESYGLFACCGILHNHESKMRGENFVTRKITKYVGKLNKFLNQSMLTPLHKDQTREVSFNDDHIIVELKTRAGIRRKEFPKLQLGNIESIRDWSHAEDMVRGMYLMMQQEKPDDFVLCSGKGRSVRDFLRLAFKCINIDNYDDYWQINSDFYRPCEVDYLQGRADKANKILDWEPFVSFDDLVRRMVQNDGV